MSFSKADINEGVELTIRNKKVRWAAVHKADDRFGDAKWKIDMIFDVADDAKEIAELKSMGLNLREYLKDGTPTDPGILYLRADSKTTTAKGKGNKGPVVVGRDGRTPFTEDIGNGSTCNVKVYVKAWKAAGKSGVKAYLNAVQVVDHVPYAGGGSFDDITGDGASTF